MSVCYGNVKAGLDKKYEKNINSNKIYNEMNNKS